MTTRTTELLIEVFVPFSALKKTTSIGTPPPNSCPVCGIHLSANELETHFLAELDRLYKLSSGPERQRIRNSFNLAPGIHPSNGMMQTPDNRWEVSLVHWKRPIFNSIKKKMYVNLSRTCIFHRHFNASEPIVRVACVPKHENVKAIPSPILPSTYEMHSVNRVPFATVDCSGHPKRLRST